jgi:uncharacterized protein YbaP (TraB family)
MMKRSVALAGLLAALLLFEPAAQAQATRNFLWKVSGAGSDLYLVGSIHLLTKDYYPLNPALDTAFKDATVLVEEADLAEMEAPTAQFTLLTRGMLPANQSLETVLPPATYAMVAKRITALGLPIEALKRFKPWMLAMTLVEMEWQKAGFDASLGLDRHFYDRARTDGKPVQGLETIEYQLSLFDGMTLEQQGKMLKESLEDLDDERANVVKLTDAWKGGDAAAVERIMLDDMKGDPIMYQRLLVDRNRAWLPKLDTLLANRNRAFVVVGAAHLVGPDGLLAMFRAKGYKVVQL